MILRVEHLSMAFGPKRVLEDVSFGVAPRTAVALMGPNGAGKTTILRCVLGLLDYRGRIEIDGLDARRNGVAARSRIGYVPQVPPLVDMTARETLRFLARVRRIPDARIDRILARVELTADADRDVRTFSGGMRQRLSVAGALLGDPPLLLLDEPTANLDASARADLLELLQTFRRAGKTLVISTHRAREVRGLADRVILLRDGRLAADGTPDDVLPADRMALAVRVSDPEEKGRVGNLLTSIGVVEEPTRNGCIHGILRADRIALVVDRLRQSGVPGERINFRPLDDEVSS